MFCLSVVSFFVLCLLDRLCVLFVCCVFLCFMFARSLVCFVCLLCVSLNVYVSDIMLSFVPVIYVIICVKFMSSFIDIHS